ncbi:MAG TPA: carboxypeptidase regulatory-like domain-containing protein [Vicinamibacterales bacterium]|nr:carboxypeptidase regulatory-like domain-containing protein [Vicinamibacterales bacterium]
MTTSFRYAWIVFALIAWLPASAAAQSGSAIAGTVRDASGAVIPGVTVEAASPALIEKLRVAVTDEAGRFTIVNLRPGTYAVTFTLPGFSTVKREGIELTASFTATVNVEMRVGTLEETITVTGETSTVDVQNVIQQRVMTRDVMDAIPAGTKSVVALGVLIPGMTTNSQDVGGTQYGSAAMAIHGSRLFEQALLYDGMYYNNGAGRGGSFVAVSVNDATVREISLETGGLSAESELGGVRGNVIPKDGGNSFEGFLAGAFTNHKLQSRNLSDDLQAQGLTSVDRVNYIYDFNPAAGGPIRADKLWFFGAYRQWETNQYMAGLYYNKSTVPWIKEDDLSRPAYEGDEDYNGSIRLTWQASPRNKVSAQHQEALQIRDHFYTQSATNRTQSPEAVINYYADPSRLTQITWNAPWTNRVLFEAGWAYAAKDFQFRLQIPDGITEDDVPWRDLGTGFSWGNLSSTYGHNDTHQWNTRFVTSYVTGSHAAKVGFTFQHAWVWTTQDVANDAVTLQLRNGVPTQLTQFATPLEFYETTKANIGLFAQDQWRLSRFTLNLGVRFDYLNSYVPEQYVGPGPLAPNRSINFAKVEDVPNWKNVSPRVGVSWDLFGNGRTAIKANVGRYLEGPNLTTFTRRANPAAAIVTQATRTWNDTFYPVGDPRRGNFSPDCDLLLPGINGECGAVNPSNFGTTNPTVRYADDALTQRGFNWEASAAIQHEILPRVSVNAGYFRRTYGNFLSTDNLNIGPTDYSPYCATAPVDSRLPDGGGYQVCGLYDPNRIVAQNNVVTLSNNFGDQTEVYNGVDFSVNLRLPSGAVLQGGTSTGRVTTDNCFVVDSPQQLLNCNVTPPFLTQVKVLGVYPWPWWGLQTSATLQSLPGPEITAARSYTSAEVIGSLGRPLTSGTATVPLIEPGTTYGGRLNQVDFRLSKVFRVGPEARVMANVDLYNMFNASPTLALNTTYGSAWLRPLQILQGRLLKFSAQLDF